MNDNVIQAILFDYGGVLAEEGFKNGLVALAKEQGLSVNDLPYQGMLAVYDSGFVLGKGSASDFWSLLRQRTGLQGDDKQLTEKILNGFVVRQWMMELMQILRKQGYITGILSDQTHWLDILDNKYHFYAEFDYVYNSYYRGKGKQDSTLFVDVAKELALPSSTILFVDDNSGNVQRARKQGWQTIQYREREQFMEELQWLLSCDSLID